MRRLRRSSKARSAVAMQTTPSSSCRLSRLPRLDDRANKTMEMRRGNAGQTFVHMLSPGDPKTSSVEQNLDGEPSWDGRESAGPDDRGHISPRSPREWSN